MLWSLKLNSHTHRYLCMYPSSLLILRLLTFSTIKRLINHFNSTLHSIYVYILGLPFVLILVYLLGKLCLNLVKLARNTKPPPACTFSQEYILWKSNHSFSKNLYYMLKEHDQKKKNVLPYK